MYKLNNKFGGKYMFKRIVVVEKWTYLLLIIPIGAIIKIIYDGCMLLPEGIYEFVFGSIITATVGAVGFYLFIRMNTHSAWHNPDHPIPEDKPKK